MEFSWNFNLPCNWYSPCLSFPYNLFSITFLNKFFLRRGSAKRYYRFSFILSPEDKLFREMDAEINVTYKIRMSSEMASRIKPTWCARASLTSRVTARFSKFRVRNRGMVPLGESRLSELASLQNDPSSPPPLPVSPSSDRVSLLLVCHMGCIRKFRSALPC